MQDSENTKINEDMLFLALTRPAMLYGIPMEAGLASVMIGGFAMVFSGSIFYLLVTVPMLVISRAICKTDHNAFTVLAKWLDTKAKCINKGYWGGSSTTPLKLVRRYKYQEL